MGGLKKESLKSHEQAADFFFQERKELFFEPGMFFYVSVVAPGRVWEGENFWAEAFGVAVAGGFPDGSELSDGFPEAGFGEFGHVIGLRVATYCKQRFDLRHIAENFLMPRFLAFWPWGLIAAFGVQSRKTEAHGDNCKFGGVVEDLFANAHPVAQAISGRVCKRSARGVDAGSRCLTAYGDARRRRQHNNGPRLMRQWLTDGLLNTDPTRGYALF